MRIDHTITCLGPMSHGSFGGDTGNVQLFRRIPRVYEGRVVYVPAISSGALRGVVRRLLWYETFDRVGLSREAFPGPGSWDRLYAALCNGGTIESAERRVSPDKIRSRRLEMPVLSLLGSALYSSHMAGMARVSNSWLRCQECGDEGVGSCWDYLAEESRVRHIDMEEQDPDCSSVGPMPTTTETVVTGSVFVGHAQIRGDVERSAWAHGLDMVTHLGGKTGQGFGGVKIGHTGTGSNYVAWLGESIQQLRTSLLLLADELGEGKKRKKRALTKEKSTRSDVGRSV